VREKFFVCCFTVFSNPTLSAIFSIVELAERLLHLADITNNSTISMAISKVVISENVPCNGWLWK
jgi:hypothetical protein